MKLKKLPSIILAVLMQIMPICRVLYHLEALPACGYAVISPWVAGAAALFGYHAIAGASVLINSATTATATVGTAFTYRITTTENYDGMVYSAAPVPAGMTPLNNSSSFFVSGVPTTPGTTTVNLTVTDGNGAYGSVSGSVVITVGGGSAPPTITLSPQNTTVTVGQTANFSVTAAGATGYQWKFKGTNISGASLSTYSLANVQITNAGNYSATVSNTHGFTNSAAATLTVLTLPTITSQPQNATALVGQSASFTVAATNSLPLTYQWQFGGANIASATITKYTIASCQATNAGNYTVVVTDAGGSVTSSVAALTINIPPSITVQPVGKTINQGGTATLLVTAAGTANLVYQWTYSNSIIAGGTARGLAITNAQPAQAGNYVVIVSNGFGAITSAPALLTVNYSPIISSNPTNLSVAKGSNATFAVVANGVPAPLTYQWYFNSNSLSGATASSYTVVNAQTTNQGNYYVTVTDTIGSTNSANAALTVTGASATASLISGALKSNKFSLSFNTTAGLSYTVQVAPSVGAAWMVLTNFIAATTNSIVTDAVTNKSRFYRISSP